MRSTATTPSHSTMGIMMGRALSRLNQVPYSVLALPLRFAVATVFWNSGMAKLANWETTISLFTDDYQVPLLPPVLTANMALTIELTTPVLLILGLFTRAAALVLLGMTAVIEIFVYPLAWPTHIQCSSSCSAAGLEISHWIACFGAISESGSARTPKLR
jgi:putative oxidoreductase